MSFLASRRMAVVLGILIPLGETVRRWETGGPWWVWADAFLIGAFLLYGAWRVWLLILLTLLGSLRTLSDESGRLRGRSG